jgi:hemerythrin superfamily protein
MYVETSGYPGQLFHRLVEEHREILATLDATLEVDDSAGFARVAQMIRIHARAEEAVIFPVLDGSYELAHHVREDVEEHRTIEAQLREIAQRDAMGKAWHDQARALRVMLVRHFQDEEEVVFPRARNVINPRSNELLELYEIEREFLARQAH